MASPFHLTPLRLAALASLLLAGRAAWRLVSPQFRHTLAEQNRSRVIIQHASDAIITTDENQRILLANPSAAAMFGTTVVAMEGALLKHFIPREQRSANGTAEEQYFGATGIRLPSKGRRATDYVMTGLRASGQHFPLEGSVSSLNEEGHPIYTIILRDVTERKLVQQKLEQSYAQLRELSAALQTIREEERTHIARELHDDLGQLLATLGVNLALLQQQPASESAARLMADTEALLRTAITSLRRIASNLRPRALDEGGLYFALESLRHEFIRRHGIACTLEASEEDLVLNDTYSTAIFRIVQEALTNIARHAQASKVKLQLQREEKSLQLTVHDNGRGIAEQEMDKASSFGLVGMRERVWALQGEISIVSDGGTLIAISLPLPPSDDH
jgi:PAS domain S-box-containing protein